MDILTNLSPSVHLYRFSLQLRQFYFDWTAGVGSWHLKLQFEVISNQVVSIGACSLPFEAVFAGLNLKPIIILLFVVFDVDDDGL